MLKFLSLYCLAGALLFPAGLSAASSGVVELPTPAAAGSMGANLASGPDGTLYLTWSEPSELKLTSAGRDGGRSLRLATLAPSASAWSAPQTIVATPLFMENWADFASFCVGTDGSWTAQWFQRPTPTAPSYSGWFSRSEDRGASWRTPTPLGHEFVSLAPLSGGRTLAVWLESVGAAHGHDGHAATLPGQPSMRLMASLLLPNGSTAQSWIVDPDVCNCCQTSLIGFAQDRALVVYRGHSQDETRDHRYAHFDGTDWGAPASLHHDGWKIAACPVNGPAAAARGDHTVVAWFTAAQGQPRVWARVSKDRGQNWGAVIPVDLGRPMGRLELVMLPDNSAVVLWLEAGAGDTAAGIYARRIFSHGETSAARQLTDSSQKRSSGFPRAAMRPDGRVAVAWTVAGDINRVHTGQFTPTELLPARPNEAGPSHRP